MAEPVLLISSDPFLGASVEAVAHGRLRVARLDPSRRPMVWPAGSTGTVVLDVTVRQRAVLHDWVRRHHPGPMVVLLKPGEQQLSLPPSPPQVVIGRPFRLADLVSVLEHPSFPPAAPAPDPDPPPRPPGPATAPPLPRPDWPTARTRLDVRRRRPWWRRPVVTRVLLGLLVLVVLAGAWLAIGLFEARRDLQVGAAGVRSELAAAETALADGRTAEAAAHVRAARASLRVAAAVPERPELRVAARLPVLAGGVADTRRLLAAADELTTAAERAVAVTARLGPGQEAVLHGGRFDLGALEDAASQARDMLAGLAAARERLVEVRGGPLAPGVDGTRRWALDRVAAATARAAPLLATLDALPTAAGADRPHSYLLVLTTTAGPGTGGAPLAAREVVLDHGAATLRPGAGALLDALGRAGSPADLRASGPALLSAARSPGRDRPDGLVTLDPLAVRAVLAATGPVGVPGHGRLDADGAERRLTGDTDRGYAQAVLEATAGRLLGGRDLLAAGRALGEAGAGGHLRAYAADPAVARLLAHLHLDGAPAATGP
ncbi:MAG TPA: hypothetical protein VHK02_15205 [Actinomycetota bacterium]|nr:hypothetical protein [Actinomycetota bacterium]